MLLRHCSDARYVWNLCVEQQSWWRPGRESAPGYLEQARQLTAARAERPWLREGSQMVQQQALRDFAQAMRNFFARTHRRPRWRKKGEDEGFRVVAISVASDVRRLNRNHGEVKVPKVGWVRFRWSRAVPKDVKSYRVTLDRSGRWHVAFAVIPDPVLGPGTGEVVGIDRGIAVSAALSTGELLSVPGLSACEAARLRRLERKLARAKRGIEPQGWRQAIGRAAEGPRGRPTQGLGREGLHRPGAPVRRDPRRGSERQGHDPVGQGNRRRAGPQRRRQGRPEPGDRQVRLGPPGPPP